MTKKTLGYLAAAVIVALGLSGCFRLTQEITLHSDDTVSGVFVIAFEEQYAGEDLSQLTGGGDPGSEFTNAVVTEYKQDGYVGSKVTFTDEPIASIADGEELSITRDGDNFVVDGTLGDASQVPEGAERWLSITFPGAVSDHNGTLAGNTVTWDAADAQYDVHAVGSAVESGGGISSIVWIVLLLLLIAGVGAFVVIQRRKSGAAPAAEAPPAE